MQMGKLKTDIYEICTQDVRGSLTVEAAIIVPVVLFCILWMAESCISLYSATVEIVQQAAWEEFYPAGKFWKLEMLEEVLDIVGAKGK